MKNIKRAIGTLAVVLGLSSAAVAAPGDGATYVRYSVDTAMTATDVDSNATGRVRAFVKQQGNSDHQRFALNVAGLDPRTPYTLHAEVGEGNVIPITTFTTAASGRGSIAYFQNRALKDNGHNGKGAGASKRALPESMTPLTEVIAVSIVNTNGEVVLSANLHESTGLTYELAATFANTGADPYAMGVMAMAVQNGVVQFRLFAAGQSTEFNLSVNDAPVATYPADVSGRINVGVFPSAAPSPVRFRSVAVRNSAQALVLESRVR